MKQKFSVSLSLALVLAMLVTSLALADQVINTIDTTIDPALESRTIDAGSSTTVGYYIKNQNTSQGGDPVNQCNVAGGFPATVTLNVPSGVTASPSSLVFTDCDVTQYITFSSSTPNSYTISVQSVSGGRSGGAWDTAPAAFMLIVNPPADSTPPVITPNVSGTLGDNGWYVSDVTVSWSVVDNESAISSSSGCGPTTINADTAGQTLTCTATSTGGTNSQSVTIKRDATAPTISGSASPAPNGAGWNNSDVAVTFTCGDNLSGVASCGPDQTLSSEGAGQSANGTAFDNAGNSANASVSGINIDKTAPTVSASASPAANANGWNNTNVTVSFSGSDSLSGIASCDVPVTLSGEGAGQSASGSCTDLAGNSASATASGINIDKTSPVFGACPAVGPFILNSGLQLVGPISVDAAISGLNTGASTLSGSVDTSSIGLKTINFTAFDNADNSGIKGCSYSVIYSWAGFFQPIDMGMLNVVKGGSGIPVKFSLSGNQGLGIFAAGYPRSVKINCDVTAPTDDIETVTAGGSGLSYDALADQYVYVWKTEKSWANTCRQLQVTLNDGTSHTANFKFK